MPIFAVSGNAFKHDGWGVNLLMIAPPAIDSAVSQAEAVGRMIMKLQQDYPIKDGWGYNAQATEVPVDWLTKALAYEQTRSH